METLRSAAALVLGGGVGSMLLLLRLVQVILFTLAVGKLDADQLNFHYRFYNWFEKSPHSAFRLRSIMSSWILRCHVGKELRLANHQCKTG